MSLNSSQRRAVTVTLRLLEERLADIERVLQNDEQGVLYRRVARFTLTQREQMRNLIAAMREEIRRAARQFDLPQEEQDATRYIIGTLSLSWESLEEIRARKLKSYGEVDPALKETLDPIVRQLIQLLFRLQHAAREDDSNE
jgi:hypothetical protein